MKNHFAPIMMFTVAALAADFAPPPEAISLEDSRMAEFCASPENRAVLTGRLVDVPDEIKGKVEVTCQETLFTSKANYATKAVQVGADGSFQIEFDLPVPLRRVTLRLAEAGPFKVRTFDVLLAKGLNVDCRYMPEKTQVAFATSGLDKELNDVVYRYENLERKKQNEFWKRMPIPAREGVSLDEALNEISAAKQGLEDFLRANAPEKYGWIFQEEIDVGYALAVLSAGVRGFSLEDRPEWAQVMAVKPYVFGVHSCQYYRFLDMYLRESINVENTSLTKGDRDALGQRRLKKAFPELVKAYKEYKDAIDSGRALKIEGSEREIGAGQLLQNAGFFRPDAKLKVELALRHYKGRIPDEKLDLLLLQEMPVEPDETRAALESFSVHVAGRWPKLFVARLETKCASMDAVLAKAAAVPLAGFNRSAQTLPSGAKLYCELNCSGKELLKRSRKAFPEKTFLLGFWLPWDRSCQLDIQRSEKARVMLNDMPVEFFYLGCSTDEATWKAEIAEFGGTGIHVLLTPKQQLELKELFGNKGYRSYVVIDKKGDVRPSTLKTFSNIKIEELRKMLE